MPYYEYLCGMCKKIETVRHGMNYEPGVYCINCDSKMTKLISRPAGFRGLPTTKHHEGPVGVNDPGFQREYTEVWDEPELTQQEDV